MQSPTKRAFQTNKYKLTQLPINTHLILTSGNVIDLLLGGLSTTFLRLAATGNKKNTGSVEQIAKAHARKGSDGDLAKVIMRDHENVSYQLLNPVHLLDRQRRALVPRLQLYLGDERIKIRLT